MFGDAARRLRQTVSRAAAATTTAAGAAGGAAVNGVVGGVTGAVTGIQRGIGSGSRSVPAAALALGVVGVTGLVEWPVVLAVGAGALALRQLNQDAPPAQRKTKTTTPAKKTTRSSGAATKR